MELDIGIMMFSVHDPTTIGNIDISLFNIYVVGTKRYASV